VLRLKAGKTGKKADFDSALSLVQPDLLARHRAMDVSHLMLLSTEDGYPVFAKDLRREYDRLGRKPPPRHGRRRGGVCPWLEAMVLRDMRKRAADLAQDNAEASGLLQHSSVALTIQHYRTRATKLKPVR
jgi:hypothetical protein